MTSPADSESTSSSTPFSRRSFLGLGFGSSLLAAVTGRAHTKGTEALEPSLHDQFPHREFSGLSSGPAGADSIASVYETIKREGTPEELYKFLYALPKGGDIHHHLGGSMLPQMWWDIATDQSRNGGQTFYTRFKLSNVKMPAVFSRWMGPNTIKWMTIHQALFDSLEPDAKEDF